MTSFLLESSAELALARGRMLVGDELSDREDFLVGDVDGETCAAIGIMPGMWPPERTERDEWVNRKHLDSRRLLEVGEIKRE